jgi:hypothetical protein
MKVLIGVDPHKASLSPSLRSTRSVSSSSALASRRTAPALGHSNAGRNGSLSAGGRWRTLAALRSPPSGELGGCRRMRGGRATQAFGKGSGAL